jgi:hypothetical protein
MGSADRDTPVPPQGRHSGVEPSNGHHAGEGERLERMEKTVDDTWGLMGKLAAGQSKLESGLHKLETGQTILAKEMGQVKANVTMLVEAQQKAALHVASEPPPMRDRLPSLVDVNELEKLPPTHDGQPRYGMTSGQMAAVIETKVEQRVSAALDLRDLKSAAKPWLFMTGRFFPALVLALAGAAGMGLWALISHYLGVK